MCIVVDICVLHRVFSEADDVDYGPVKKWLVSGRGRMVFGGKKYSDELKAAKKYLAVVLELKKAGKIVMLDGDVVDREEQRVRAVEPDLDFDDPHIIAIVEASRCRIVCTADARSDRFLRDRKFYVNAARPSIYRSSGHAHMLRDSNIVGVCAC